MKKAYPQCIVSFNTKVGRGGPAAVASIREIIRDNPDVDVIVCQEAQGYIDDFKRELKGWKTYARPGWNESMMSPVLVRRSNFGVRTRFTMGWGVVKNIIRWEHKKEKPGRTWTWVRVGKMTVLSLHRVTDGNGKNVEAYLEEARRLKTFYNQKNKKRVVVAFGDTNTGYGANYAGSMREIRQDVKGLLLADEQEPGVDYALVRGMTGKVRRTKNYGSDHKAAVMKVTALNP